MNGSKGKNFRNDWIDVVRNQVDSLHFGVVQIVIHESKVVQIEKTEKIRFDDSKTNTFPQTKNSNPADDKTN